MLMKLTPGLLPIENDELKKVCFFPPTVLRRMGDERKNLSERIRPRIAPQGTDHGILRRRKESGFQVSLKHFLQCVS